MKEPLCRAHKIISHVKDVSLILAGAYKVKHHDNFLQDMVRVLPCGHFFHEAAGKHCKPSNSAFFQ